MITVAFDMAHCKSCPHHKHCPVKEGKEFFYLRYTQKEMRIAMGGHNGAERVVSILRNVRALEGRLSTLEAFDIPDKHFPKIRDRNVITHSAIVDLKEFEHRYKFFENVAVNRGFSLRIFSNTDEAIEWLMKCSS